MKWNEFNNEEELLSFLSKSHKSPTQKHKRVAIAGGYRSHAAGWLKIGNNRAYFKSLWEMNYAYYLEWLKKNKEIEDWEYEPELFRFPSGAYKAGPFYYKPDFKLKLKKACYEWHEVKGVLNSKSKKKIKRFEKHFPGEGKIVILDKHWFKQANKTLATLVPGWLTYPQYLKKQQVMQGYRSR